MPFEQLALEIGIGVALGTVIAIMAFLSTSKAWDNRLFAYTLVIGVFTTFAVIEGIEGGVDESNLIKVALMVGGASFFSNKSIQMAERVRAKAK